MSNVSKETTVDGLLTEWRSDFTDLNSFSEKPEFDESFSKKKSLLDTFWKSPGVTLYMTHVL